MTVFRESLVGRVNFRHAAETESPEPTSSLPSHDVIVASQALHRPFTPVLNAHTILAMQRLLGNRAVRRLIDRAQQSGNAGDIEREVDEPTLEEAVLKALQPVGQPFPSDLGQRFATIHTGSDSSAPAKAVGARAFTVGKDIQSVPPAVGALQRQTPGTTPTPQPSPGTTPAPQTNTSPGLGPTRTQMVQDCINANDFQGAVDTLVGFKYMDYEIDFDLLANKKMVFDPNLTSSDATTSMATWDYINNKANPATVKIGPSAFSSVPFLYSVVMHEYQHVLWQQTLAQQQISSQAHQQGFVAPEEVEAGAWELMNAGQTGIAKMPGKVAQIWSNLNKSFWGLDAQSQKSERPLVLRAFQKAKDYIKGSQVTLDPFAAPSTTNP